MCRVCRGTYGETDQSKHAWDMPRSNGDGTHTFVCYQNSDHTKTEDCSGVRCGETGWCEYCFEDYTVSHQLDGIWASDADQHWQTCIQCKERQNEAPHSLVERPDAEYLKSEATCASPAVYFKVCSDCGYQASDTFESGDIAPDKHDLIHHEAKAATCTEIGWEAYDTCARCDYSTYVELPALGHDPIHHDAQAATCTEIGWETYDTCSRCDYSTYVELPALGHDPIHHEAKVATCTEIGWEAYDTCSRCDYSTYVELPALGHDLIHHEAKAATCTEIGWEAYDTCSRCDYSTYVELTAGGHDLIHHDAQAATCMEIGWEAYDTCSRCDYTTYVELPALGHDYQDKTVPRSCTKDGYTLHTCARCAYSYKDAIRSHRGHWYGEWTANGNGAHAADCQRNGCRFEKTVACESIELPSLNVSLCPVCGLVSDGTRLALLDASVKTLSDRIPRGEAVLRLGMLQSGEQILSVGFEYGGRLSQLTGQVEVTLPAELLDGYALMLPDADGAETMLFYTLNGGEATFTWDFAAGENRAMVLRLAPVS